ncbi:MAG: hypothetical protein IJJ86_06860 [Clostridia bacterium]|nr:hypothetical protein [Clostridia bacterium]
MKQQKVNGYAPKYPKRILCGAALAAAALFAVGASTGCAVNTAEKPLIGGVPQLLEPTPEPMELGYIATMPPDVELQTDGMISVDEPTPEPDELMLSGDVMIGDDFQ